MVKHIWKVCWYGPMTTVIGMGNLHYIGMVECKLLNSHADFTLSKASLSLSDVQYGQLCPRRYKVKK